MTSTSSSIESQRLALDLAVERFRIRAVAELQRLRDHLPRKGLAASQDADHGPAEEPWERARRRHQLARQGLIPAGTEFIPSAAPATILGGELRGPEPKEWSAERQAA